MPVTVFAFDKLGPKQLERYAEIGVERAAVVLPRNNDDALRYMDGLAEQLPPLD